MKYEAKIDRIVSNAIAPITGKLRKEIEELVLIASFDERTECQKIIEEKLNRIKPRFSADDWQSLQEIRFAVAARVFEGFRERQALEMASWLTGTCNECGFNVVVTQPDSEKFPTADFQWYCSNKQCSNHAGEHAGDEEAPEWVKF